MGADLSPRLRELPERPAVFPVSAWRGFFADPDGFAGHLARAAVARLRELTPRLALSLGRLTGRRSSRQAEFVPDPSWGTVRQPDARTLMPLANRAVKHFRALV